MILVTPPHTMFWYTRLESGIYIANQTGYHVQRNGMRDNTDVETVVSVR